MRTISWEEFEAATRPYWELAHRLCDLEGKDAYDSTRPHDIKLEIMDGEEPINTFNYWRIYAWHMHLEVTNGHE